MNIIFVLFINTQKKKNERKKLCIIERRKKKLTVRPYFRHHIKLESCGLQWFCYADILFIFFHNVRNKNTVIKDTPCGTV